MPRLFSRLPVFAQAVAACAVVILLSGGDVFCNALSVQLKANAEECFYLKNSVSEDGSLNVITGYFEVTSGGYLDVDFLVFSPQGNSLHNSVKQMSERFAIDASENGEYKLCFSNKMSTLTTKTVSFNARIISKAVAAANVAANSEIAGQEHIQPIEVGVRLLLDDIRDMQSRQKYMNTRERVHRDTVESTNDRVKYFSVIEFIVLVITNVWQIHALRKFFEKKRSI